MGVDALVVYHAPCGRWASWCSGQGYYGPFIQDPGSLTEKLAVGAGLPRGPVFIKAV